MIPNTDKSKESIALTSNRTVYILPFWFEEEKAVLDALESPLSIWGKAELSVVKNIFYPHIQNYLQADANFITCKHRAEKLVSLYTSLHSEEMEDKENRGNIFGLRMALLAIPAAMNDGADYLTKYMYVNNQDTYSIKGLGLGIFLPVAAVILYFGYRFYK